MTYETVARIAQQGGLVYFALLFLGGCAYALWPKNGDEFARAARLPLEEEEL
ncbi:MAG TPA: cbb3-type cytochrome c oxidase subunit 3 [Caulobacter sp.]|jgi:cytochrome c oxidase cbb3-type subunit 4|nr:cbb3-type cytochrome c oxidase subunit 3 [Caulobacter sp.]